MGFFNGLRTPREATAPAPGFHLLTFGPAILRMTGAGRDTATELEALAAAVADLGYPQGFSTDRVFAAASEMARLVKIDGVAGVTDRMQNDLSPELKAEAMRLALVALFKSPHSESGDIGVLSRMAGHIGMSRAEFEALVEAAKTVS